MQSLPRLFDLTGRVVLVTGGGRGLGAQMARGLAEHGAAVALASRKKDACDAVAEEIARDFGVKTVGLAVDVADEASVAHMVDAAEQALGPIDALLNNSGASWGAPATDMPVAAWDKVMNVNARGTFLASREVARRWLAAGRGGAILNVASVAGLVGSPVGILDAAGYSASKAAVVGLTKDLAVKWAPHGIRVNALAPGYFPTDMTKVVLQRSGDAIVRAVPMGRVGAEMELNGAAVFLLSDAASYVTGQVLAVDGGMTAQ